MCLCVETIDRVVDVVVQFIREDLEHIDASSDIQASFHGTDDFISVHELWQIWISSAGTSQDYHCVRIVM